MHVIIFTGFFICWKSESALSCIWQQHVLVPVQRWVSYFRRRVRKRRLANVSLQTWVCACISLHTKHKLRQDFFHKMFLLNSEVLLFTDDIIWQENNLSKIAFLGHLSHSFSCSLFFGSYVFDLACTLLYRSFFFFLPCRPLSALQSPPLSLTAGAGPAVPNSVTLYVQGNQASLTFTTSWVDLLSIDLSASGL